MKVLLNWRYYVMMLIGTITIFGIFSVPFDDIDPFEWTWKFLLSKGIGFGAGYVLYKLFVRWDSKNLVPELSKMALEE